MRSADKVMLVRIRHSDADLQQHTQGGTRSLKLNISSQHFELTTTTRLSIIVTSGNISGVGLLKKVQRSGDFDILVQIDHLYQLSNPVPLDQFTSTLEAKFRDYVTNALAWNGVIPPTTARAVLSKLKAIGPDLKNHLEFLQQLLSVNTKSLTPTRATVLEQRDAFALGLELAGVDNREIIPQSLSNTSVPFLRSLESSTTHEGAIIRSDAQYFDDWFGGATETHDVWRYSDPSNPARRITVIYADKTPLEVLTGTDLIYYREETASFVLVQYKRMKIDQPGNKMLYRPDPQLFEEISRMEALGLTDVQAGKIEEARLSWSPFYIKLVEPGLTKAEGNRLAKGMYFPLEVFMLMVQDPRHHGPKGGVQIGWHNAMRYLSNGMFTSLVRESWIGTRGATSETLTALIHESLQNNRGVVLVADQSEHSRIVSRKP